MKPLLPLLLLFPLACGPAPKRETIRASDFGEKWPFTVKEGTLACDGSGGHGAVTVTVNGVAYALNGTAEASGKYADLNDIWLPADPMWLKDTQTGQKFDAARGSKKDVTEIIERGLKLCE